jgi:hypothetical protein
MSADGRQALARGLSELAGHQVRSPRDATPPGTYTQEDGTGPGQPTLGQAR